MVDPDRALNFYRSCLVYASIFATNQRFRYLDGAPRRHRFRETPCQRWFTRRHHPLRLSSDRAEDVEPAVAAVTAAGGTIAAQGSCALGYGMHMFETLTATKLKCGRVSRVRCLTAIGAAVTGKVVCAVLLRHGRSSSPLGARMKHSSQLGTRETLVLIAGSRMARLLPGGRGVLRRPCPFDSCHAGGQGAGAQKGFYDDPCTWLMNCNNNPSPAAQLNRPQGPDPCYLAQNSLRPLHPRAAVTREAGRR